MCGYCAVSCPGPASLSPALKADCLCVDSASQADQTGSWASDLPSPSVPHVTCSAMGWFQRPNKIDTHVFCPNLPRESNAFASMCTFRDGTDSRHRKEAILAPRSRYLQSKPRSPWRTWRKRDWRDVFQFIEVYTWKLLKGGTCGLLRL